MTSTAAATQTGAARPHCGTQVEFAFVDVFADRPLTGNPLAVVPDADALEVSQMRAIAREFNQSETTFLRQPDRPGVDWRLRSFTPAGAEVGGAGHNALGAWLWLAHTGRVGAGVFRQQIGEDVLNVEVTAAEHEPTRVVMQQSAPVFGAVVAADQQLAAALGLTEADLDESLSAQVVSTGAAHLLIPLRDRAAVDRVSADPRALLDVLRPNGGEGCYVYTTAGHGHDDDGGHGLDAHAYTRFFNPTVGISEDPATGTAAGPLAAALIRAGRVADDITVRIEQGHALGRPSRLQIEVSGAVVRLTGSGLVVGHGWLAI